MNANIMKTQIFHSNSILGYNKIEITMDKKQACSGTYNAIKKKIKV